MTATTAKQRQPKVLSRRNFLISTGWIAGGVTVLSACSSILPALPVFDDPEPGDGAFWIQMGVDGRVRFLCPRMEMGQGASVGLTQIVAQELNLPPSGIDCVAPTTAQIPPVKMTVGSESLQLFSGPVSRAAAQLREVLRGRAAALAGIPGKRVEDSGAGFALPGGRRVTYAELVTKTPLVLSDGDKLPDGPPEQYMLSGRGRGKFADQDWRRGVVADIVTGRAVFARDVVLDGMVYGGVLRPPRFGARLRRVDDSGTVGMAGVVAVVVDLDANFAGVAVEDPFALPDALAALNADWEMPEGGEKESPFDVERAQAKDDFEHTLASEGKIATGRARAKRVVSGRYDTGFAAHAAMEPRSAVVRIQRDKVEVWCGTQAPFFVRRRVAKLIGRSEEAVIVHPQRMGGGFGGGVANLAAEEAARLAAVVRRPVRVQWSREEEFRYNYFQPPFSHAIEAGVTPDGRISHWRHDFVSAPIMFGQVPSGLEWAVDLLADEGTSRGGIPPYALAHHRIRYSDIRVPQPTGAWRGLGAAPNGFAIESMVDELAAAAGLDPVAFRIANLPPERQRLIDVLRRVSEISAWHRGPRPGYARGVACAIYKDATYAAVVAEVRADKGARAFRVERIWCAHDCGLAVNRDQITAQIAGNVIWGSSMALTEGMIFADGEAEAENFDGYEILRAHEAPEIEIALIDCPDQPVAGAGETVIAPTAAAVANAVSALTGRRVRRLPIDYDVLVASTE